jgi:F0F1-type ATP synthase membrane subunit b/b'
MKYDLRRVLRVVLLSLCLLGGGTAATLPCFAAPPGAAGQSQPAEELHVSHELIFDIVNFILLVGVLVYLYRKHGKAFYIDRSESIRKSLEEGRKALEASQAQLAAAEGKLARLEDEVAALKKRTEAGIAEDQERIRQAAVEEAQKVLEHTKVQIRAATNAAKLELKDYAVKQALGQAASLVRERLDEGNRRRLVDFFLADLNSKISRN